MIEYIYYYFFQIREKERKSWNIDDRLYSILLTSFKSEKKRESLGISMIYYYFFQIRENQRRSWNIDDRIYILLLLSNQRKREKVLEYR